MKKELAFYELMLLLKFSPIGNETELTDRIEYYRDFLVDRGSEVMLKNSGKISLAYPIKDCDTATSVQIVYLGNGELIKQLNTEIQRDPLVLRATTTILSEQKTLELFPQPA